MASGFCPYKVKMQMCTSEQQQNFAVAFPDWGQRPLYAILHPCANVHVTAIPHVGLSPALMPIQLSPTALTPIQLSPLALMPIQLSPLALTPIQLSPLALTPIQLSPTALTPIQLSPPALTPIQLSPLALTPIQLSPPGLFQWDEIQCSHITCKYGRDAKPP